MNFGLNMNVLVPPLSALVSILMVAGVDWVGVRMGRMFDMIGPGAPSWHRSQAPILGAMVLSVLLYPLALAGLTPRWFLGAIGAVMAILGALNGVSALRRALLARRLSYGSVAAWVKTHNGWHMILAVLLSGMGITSLAAVTNADSLDYHIGVAISILNNGSFPVTPEWFTYTYPHNLDTLLRWTNFLS